MNDAVTPDGPRGCGKYLYAGLIYLFRRLVLTCFAGVLGFAVATAGGAQNSSLTKAEIPAFPGAEGAGAFTPGGRGGKIFEVTNLNDNGPGSLREALEARGPRIIVFRVSGIITLDKVLSISNPYVTVAGQSAPGDGICIRGQTTEINTHDVVLRYLRFRRGNLKDRDDALGGYPVGNIVIDHCSASWGLDENLSLYRYMKKKPDGPDEKTPTENVTIQWCISSEALDLNNHAFGATWGGKNCSFHHNLFACNTGRNPSIGWGDRFDFRNNVLFNWRHRTVDGGDASSMVNIVANYYKPGPAVNEGSIRYRICKPQHLDMYSEAQRDGKWYVANNFVAGFPDVTADNWNGGVQFDEEYARTPAQIKAAVAKVRAAEPCPAAAITQHLAEQAYVLVLEQAGAVLPKRDPVDERIIRTVRTGKPDLGDGIIDTPSEVGGWPEYKSAPALLDSDHDGMPDDWEKKFGLDAGNPSDGSQDADGDGYTNVEEWLNGTDPQKFVDYRNPENNRNTLHSKPAATPGENISAGGMIPVELSCEYDVNPLGVDTLQPLLSWKHEGSARGLMQRSYRILVASTEEALMNDKADLWDSGKVTSGRAIGIAYDGKAPKSSHQVFWKVRVWDNEDNASQWSDVASWTTGLLDKADRQAKWIAADRTDQDPLPVFRKPFRIGKPVRQAVVHICGLGHYEMSINGRRVGDFQMDPGWTNYRKTCLYSTYDVTGMLEEGDNVIGVMLGNGMYNVPGGRYVKFKGTFGPPKLICQMHMTFADGSTRIIVSDETWKCTLGPITFTCIYGGEDYDARRELPGWDEPGFDDRAWSAVKVCDGPGGDLTGQYAPPIKVAAYLPAAAIERLEEGKYEIDCGINLSARPFVKVRGPSGSSVFITCAEKRGEPWLQNKGHTYTYTLKGRGEEVFRPRFTYFSFQYLYISGADRPEDAKDANRRPVLLEAGSEFLTSSAAAAGRFECSNPLLNDIDAMIDRSVRSNLQSVLTDCPHREKLGWLEVSHLMGPSIFYRYNVHNLYRKICRDTTESQLESGLVPDIAPEYTRFQGGFFESAEWGSACVQLPHLLQKWYGDNAIEEQQYETMKRYVDYLASTRNEQGLAKPGLGDWYDWTPDNGHRGASQLTPAELPATAFLFDNARIVAHVAERIGNKADAERFDELARQVRSDFIAAYYKPDEHSVAGGSQAALATALYFDLVPDQDRDEVLAKLVAALEKAQYRQSTGEVCFRMLVQALAEAGRSDVVYKMINRTDAPGYGHMLKLGFKTLSETWDKPGSSMNHCMFGHIQEWFDNSIVGIRQASDSAGFEKLILRPEPVGDLTSASGYYDSIRGRIESRWNIADGSFHWRIVVPPNTTAEVYVPATKAEAVTESGRPANQSPGVTFLRTEFTDGPAKTHGYVVFEVGCGEYEFESRI